MTDKPDRWAVYTGSLMTPDHFEHLLDSGRLQTSTVYMGIVSWYDCQRNGETKRWKRDATRFNIPIKFKPEFGGPCRVRVTERSFARGDITAWFRRKPDDKAGVQLRLV